MSVVMLGTPIPRRYSQRTPTYQRARRLISSADKLLFGIRKFLCVQYTAYVLKMHRNTLHTPRVFELNQASLPMLCYKYEYVIRNG